MEDPVRCRAFWHGALMPPARIGCDKMRCDAMREKRNDTVEKIGGACAVCSVHYLLVRCLAPHFFINQVRTGAS